MPRRRRWLRVAGPAILSGMAVLIGGCAKSPVFGPPEPAPAPVADEAASGDESADRAATGTGDNAPAESASNVEPSRPAQPPIAVGSEARETQYASLAKGRNALAERDLGYFVDVHEARLRQALVDTPVRMERLALQLRLTVPGSLSFTPGSADIRESARPALIAIAAVLAEFEKTLVSVHGHTDRSGDKDYNRLLSERRAVAVARFLAEHGVDPMRLVGIGHGEESPAVDGDSAADRATNRRIEILIEPIVMGEKAARASRATYGSDSRQEVAVNLAGASASVPSR